MIYTFYSFKGGVGRSMALANVAELLYQNGLKVLMVDFDLEAPGLERYFDVPEAIFRPDEIIATPGLVDLLVTYKKLQSMPLVRHSQSQKNAEKEDSSSFITLPLNNFIAPIYNKNSKGGTLSIMTAGRRNGDNFPIYSNYVRTFDWEDFYTNWNGERFFEWFRDKTSPTDNEPSPFDVVLIDSRTGVTEMGGICTYHLADVIVFFVAPNLQGFDGTLAIINNLLDPELINVGRRGRHLSFLVVPSRVELGEKRLLDRFEESYNQNFYNFNPSQLSFKKSAFADLMIPYVPYYAYYETVAVREGNRASSSLIVDAFDNLVLALSQLSPQNSSFYSIYQGKVPHNIPRDRQTIFINRATELSQLHESLQSPNIDTFAVTGLAGVGKTALVGQYVLKFLHTYSGGICWILAQDGTIAEQIIQFSKAYLDITPNADWSTLKQLEFCWQNWPLGKVLIVLDDLRDYRAIQKELLPPIGNRFQVLITSRLKNFTLQLELAPLDNEAALALWAELLGSKRIEKERSTALSLSQRLGNLPLTLELAGRYLKRKPDLSLAQMYEQLERLPLDSPVFSEVFSLLQQTWDTLNELARQIACVLGLFSAAPIPWSLVEEMIPQQSPDTLESLRDEYLCGQSLLEYVGGNLYLLHPLVREYFQQQLNESENRDDLEIKFCKVMVSTAKQIGLSLAADQIRILKHCIPHLIEIVKSSLGDKLDKYDLFEILDGLSRIYSISGNYDQAIHWCRESLEEKRERYGQEHPLTASNLNNLAELYEAVGHYAEAESLYKQSLEVNQRLLGDNHPDVAICLSNIAGLYKALGRYAEAESLYNQSLEVNQRLLGDNHPNVAIGLNNLAGLYEALGRYAEAEPLYNQSLEVNQRLLGDNHPNVAISLNNLALLYSRQGRYAEAEPLFHHALKINQRLLGSDYPGFVISLSNLAGLYEALGRYAEAEPLYKQSLEVNQRLLGDNHPKVAISLNNLALLYSRQGCYAEAEPLFHHALKINQRLLGSDHPDIISNYNNLALLYKAQGRYSEAEPLLLKGVELSRQLVGEAHPDFFISLNNLASLYEIQSRFEEAEPLYLHALQTAKQLLGNRHPQVATCLNNLASLYKTQERYEEAEDLYRETLALREKSLGSNHPDIVQSLNNLALLYVEQKRFHEAESLFMKALGNGMQLLGNQHPNIAISFNNLALLYDSWGRQTDAESNYRRALEIAEEGLGATHPTTITIRRNLNQLYSPRSADSEVIGSILDRIATGAQTEQDLTVIRRLLKVNSYQQTAVQLGKYSVNIGQGQDIHIGDRIYSGIDTETIRTALREILNEVTVWNKPAEADRGRLQ